ncbi:MAG: single-stranded-DNA-specific exonuclease RecJ [candidate division Zixibacteria bacterium]|nr:single-stranded-DNA-specific exonuclease RecJ [candidate division Zixibacteria bacterium]
MTKIWDINPASQNGAGAELSAGLNLPELVGQLLSQRGITTLDEARRFLNPQLSDLQDPFLFPQMERAALRIIKALQSKEKMMIFGDYDVDGISATALLFLTLGKLGADVSHYLPNRLTEGYGLSTEGIDEAVNRNVGLVISVDCGITACDEAEYSQKKGIDLIITDHHLPGQRIPAAYAIINPKFEIKGYPGGEISGVGVAFKLIQAVYRRLEMDESELYLHLDLVALGTSADLVDITGENRIFCKFGLEQIATSTKPGIRALANSAGLEGNQIGTAQVVFGLAPRLNAVGRLGDANLAIKLLVTQDYEQARAIAVLLETENKKRRVLDEKVEAEAAFLLSQNPAETSKAIVLASDEWHPGILGIVAARLAERMHRPTVLISFTENEGKGSARSIPGFDIYSALSACKEHLDGFGGHRQAAGVNISRARFDSFRQVFLQVAEERLSAADLTPRQTIDSLLDFQSISEELIESLELLAPFGPGNMRPVLASENLSKADNPGIVGKNHLKLKVAQKDKEFDAIGFTFGDWARPLAMNSQGFDMAYVAEKSVWKGKSRIQLRIKDIRIRSAQ